MGANLIVHECIANVFHQAVEPLGILWVIEEIRRIVLGFYRVHSPANLFQFPGNPRASDLILDLGGAGLPFQLFLSLYLIDITRNDRCAERFGKSFDSGRQRFYSSLIHPG